MAFPMCNSGFFRRAGQSFFFDNFPVAPSAVYAFEKMTSSAGSISFALRDAANTSTANLGWNTDGTITGATPTDNGTYPTLADCIAAGINVVQIWYEQTSGGSDSATNIPGSSVTIQLDANGKAELQTSGIGGSSLAFQTNQTYTNSQPITFVCRGRWNSGDSNFKPGFRARNSTNTASLASHESIRFASFGSVSFGTARTITEDIFTNPVVIHYMGNGASGNVWVNNLPENPANMGTNGTDGVFQFPGRTLQYTHFIYFPTNLTSGERTDLYNHINAY